MAYVIKVDHAGTLRRLTLEKQPGGDDGLSFSELETKIREMFQFAEPAKLKVTYLDKDKDVVTMENDQDLKDACIYQGLNPLRLNVVLASPEANSTGGISNRMPNFSTAFEGLEEPLKGLFKNLRPENVVDMFQAYEPLFKDVKHPSQIPDLVENIVKTAASQFASLSRGAGATNAGASVSAPAAEQNVPQDGPTHAQNEVRDVNVHAQNEAKDANGRVHYGVGCDGCGMVPIIGVRYKSTIRDNYDLCGSCYEKAGVRGGEYIVVDRPAFRIRHQMRSQRGRMMCPAMRNTWNPHCGMHGSQDLQGGRLDARFVRDVSIFDGTQLAPGTRFTKIWRLRNSGAVPWPANTKLVKVDGDNLGSAPITPVEIGEQGLAPEEEIEVSVDCVAPQKSGRYQSIWRLATPFGPKFGHKIWVHIQVVPSDTLDQPAQMVTDGSHVQVDQVGETSTAGGDVTFDQVVETPAAVPVELVKSDNTPHDMTVAKEVTGGLVKSDDAPQDVTVTEQESSGSDTMKMIEESFVKIDVNDNGDETPVIQMTEMRSGLSEDEKPETVTAPTVGVQETGRTEEDVSAPVEVITTEAPAAKRAEFVEAKAPVDTDEEEVSTYKPLLVRLEAMGFSDRALNIELLKANALDLRKTVDALCDVDDWAPALAELAEMGFNDIDVNLRLMFKNRGNLKRVVKELVQLAKQASGRVQ